MEHTELKKPVVFEVGPKEIESFVEEGRSDDERDTRDVMDPAIFVGTCIEVIDKRDKNGHDHQKKVQV
jgi:hypothetical protein